MHFCQVSELFLIYISDKSPPHSCAIYEKRLFTDSRLVGILTTLSAQINYIVPFLSRE